MKATWLWTAISLLLVAAGSYGLYVYLTPPPLPEQVLYGNGHIEGTEVKVSAEIPGRVLAVTFEEGNTVEKAAVLARIDDRELRLERDRAQAEISALEENQKRFRIERASWQHHFQTAQKDLDRYRTLRAKGTVPPQRLEQAENAFVEARKNVDGLEAQIKYTEAKLSAARASLALTETRLAKSTVTAPSSGTVLIKGIESGEFVQPGQAIAVLADLRNVELKVFVPEQDIGKVALSAPARVRVDAFPKRFLAGVVARVDQSAQFTPRDIHMPSERVRMVFGVTLRIENPDGLLKPGMPADAWILWRSGASWPTRLFVPE